MDIAGFLILLEFSDLFDLLHIPFQIPTKANSHSYVSEKPVVSFFHRLCKSTGIVPHFDLEDSVGQLRWTPTSLHWGYCRIVGIISDINTVYVVLIAISVYDLVGK